jgi:hypothetical protein
MFVVSGTTSDDSYARLRIDFCSSLLIPSFGILLEEILFSAHNKYLSNILM